MLSQVALEHFVIYRAAPDEEEVTFADLADRCIDGLGSLLHAARDFAVARDGQSANPGLKEAPRITGNVARNHRTATGS